MAPNPVSQPHSRPVEDDPVTRRALARSPAQAFGHGMVQSLAFLIVIFPFGLLFGVVALEAGMDMAQIVGFSVLGKR